MRLKSLLQTLALVLLALYLGSAGILAIDAIDNGGPDAAVVLLIAVLVLVLAMMAGFALGACI